MFLATDAAENAYVAVWAGRPRFTAHVNLFADGLMRLPHDPLDSSSDVLVTKVSPTGARAWTRAVGTRNEDEPFALAAGENGAVVVGRSGRFPGIDASVWDPWLAALSPDGDTIASRTLAVDDLGLLLSVAVGADGTIAVGGSDGWTQNPDGLSILQYGAKLLLTLATPDSTSVRLALPAGPRHNELRDVHLLPGELWYAGHEDGPLTHSGDSDPSQIRATGIVGALGR